MLDSLTTRLTGIFDRLRGFGRLTEENVQEALREVRVALLEADVNFKVVKDFVERVREKAIGQDVLKSLTPGQQVVKVVHDELVELLGGAGHRLAIAPHPPTVIMLVGPAGLGQDHDRGQARAAFPEAGAASAPGLRRRVPPRRHRPAADARRAARHPGPSARPAQTPRGHLRAARDEAARRGLTPLILDTAGRLHIDEEMMDELEAIKRDGRPHHVLLVVDAMTGQDAVRSPSAFHAAVGIDARRPHQDGRRRARRRGALGARGHGPADRASSASARRPTRSSRSIPTGFAARILGMGDVLSLVEKAQAIVDQDQAEELAQQDPRGHASRSRTSASQLQQLRTMGPLDQIMDMIPLFKGARARPAELEGEERS